MLALAVLSSFLMAVTEQLLCKHQKEYSMCNKHKGSILLYLLTDFFLFYLWSLLSGGIKGVPYYSPLRSLHTLPDKLIINGFLHENPGSSSAALSLVEKHSLVGLLNRIIHCKEGIAGECIVRRASVYCS